MLQVRTTLFRERAQEIKLNPHHPRLQYPRYFLLKHAKARVNVSNTPAAKGDRSPGEWPR